MNTNAQTIQDWGGYKKSIENEIGKYGLIDKSGNQVTEIKYDDIVETNMDYEFEGRVKGRTILIKILPDGKVVEYYNE